MFLVFIVEDAAYHAHFLRLFIVLFSVRHWTSSHERVETEQEQHVEEQKTNHTDDEYNNYLQTTHRPLTTH